MSGMIKGRARPEVIWLALARASLAMLRYCIGFALAVGMGLDALADQLAFCRGK
jgi:hypothetical protein